MSFKFDSMIEILNKLDSGDHVSVYSLKKGLEDIKHWIYRWIPYVEVVSPKELRDTIKKESQQALAKA